MSPAAKAGVGSAVRDATREAGGHPRCRRARQHLHLAVGESPQQHSLRAPPRSGPRFREKLDRGCTAHHGRRSGRRPSCTARRRAGLVHERLPPRLRRRRVGLCARAGFGFGAARPSSVQFEHRRARNVGRCVTVRCRVCRAGGREVRQFFGSRIGGPGRSGRKRTRCRIVRVSRPGPSIPTAR